MTVADRVLANNENWRIEDQRGVIVLIVWKRPDLSRDRCAMVLKETVPALLGLLSDTRHRGLVLDLRDAPSSWGPITHKAFVDAISAWDIARRPVAVVAADDALARIGVRALVAEAAPFRGKACATIEEAVAHAGR